MNDFIRYRENKSSVRLLGTNTTITLKDEYAYVNVKVDWNQSVPQKDKGLLTFAGFEIQSNILPEHLTHKEQVLQIQIRLMEQVAQLQKAVKELDQIRKTDSII